MTIFFHTHLKKCLSLILFISAGFIFYCSNKTSSENDTKIIPEKFVTARYETDNIDSPSVWHGPNGENWIIATAKSTDNLMVFDASDGKLIKRVCSSEKGVQQLRRPNGIAVIENLLIIVERDNHRVQVLTLPDFRYIGFIGENELIRPYGVSVYKENDKYILFVTDNYETPEGYIPPFDQLDNRVHKYSFVINENKLHWKIIKKFGKVSGAGILHIVESICADLDRNILLIADEFISQNNIKIYNLNGNFTGKIINNQFFNNQPEGITLYKAGKDNGYWITTDQSKEKTIFNVFDRKTFEFIAAFTGTTVSNTDGIALTQKQFNNFPEGAFIAVDNDGGIAGFSLQDILKYLSLN